MLDRPTAQTILGPDAPDMRVIRMAQEFTLVHRKINRAVALGTAFLVLSLSLILVAGATLFLFVGIWTAIAVNVGFWICAFVIWHLLWPAIELPNVP